MKRFLLLAAPLAALIAITSCRSTKGLERPSTATTTTPATSGTSGTSGTAAADAYVRRVAAQAATQQCITAKVKVEIEGMGKNLSVNGQLRMKRDDVVQLSLTFLGMEVGRMEFTPQDVLVVDRINKQYVRAAYSDVSFLKTAGLDFYALQSAFWNELFIPGERTIAGQTSRFALTTQGDNNVLTLNGAPSLTYTFVTSAATALINRLEVKGRSAASKGTFAFDYSDFTPLNGHQFPKGMKMSVNGTGKDVSLTLNLSRLGTDSNWNTRTEVSSKYTRQSVDAVLGKLLK